MSSRARRSDGVLGQIDTGKLPFPLAQPQPQPITLLRLGRLEGSSHEKIAGRGARRPEAFPRFASWETPAREERPSVRRNTRSSPAVNVEHQIGLDDLHNKSIGGGDTGLGCQVQRQRTETTTRIAQPELSPGDLPTERTLELGNVDELANLAASRAATASANVFSPSNGQRTKAIARTNEPKSLRAAISSEPASSIGRAPDASTSGKGQTMKRFERVKGFH